MYVVHVIGEMAGSGKTTIIEQMMRTLESEGRRCVAYERLEVVFDFANSRQKAVEHAAGADVIFMEYTRESDVQAIPGDMVITTRRVFAPVVARG